LPPNCFWLRTYLLLSHLPGWWLRAGQWLSFTPVLSGVCPWAEPWHGAGATGECKPDSPSNLAASRARIQSPLPWPVYYSVISCSSGPRSLVPNAACPRLQQQQDPAAQGSGISDSRHRSRALPFPWPPAELFAFLLKHDLVRGIMSEFIVHG